MPLGWGVIPWVLKEALPLQDNQGTRLSSNPNPVLCNYYYTNHFFSPLRTNTFPKIWIIWQKISQKQSSPLYFFKQGTRPLFHFNPLSLGTCNVAWRDDSELGLLFGFLSSSLIWSTGCDRLETQHVHQPWKAADTQDSPVWQSDHILLRDMCSLVGALRVRPSLSHVALSKLLYWISVSSSVQRG